MYACDGSKYFATAEITRYDVKSLFHVTAGTADAGVLWRKAEIMCHVLCYHVAFERVIMTRMLFVYYNVIELCSCCSRVVIKSPNIKVSRESLLYLGGFRNRPNTHTHTVPGSDLNDETDPKLTKY